MLALYLGEVELESVRLEVDEVVDIVRAGQGIIIFLLLLLLSGLLSEIGNRSGTTTAVFSVLSDISHRFPLLAFFFNLLLPLGEAKVEDGLWAVPDLALRLGVPSKETPFKLILGEGSPRTLFTR